MSDYAVVNPATGETVARYDQFTDAQVEEALTRAQTAFEEWRSGRLPCVPGRNPKRTKVAACFTSILMDSQDRRSNLHSKG